jgi:hypothetical protein
MNSADPPTPQQDGDLREEILKAGTVRFASGSFIQKHYSNGTVSPIEHKVQEVVEIGIDDLMQLITLRTRRAEIEGRIDELTACLSQVPMPSLSYEQVENRIAELEAFRQQQSNLDGLGGKD